MNVKGKKRFQPIVRDDNDTLRRRYEKLAKKTGLQRQTLAQKIFEKGMNAIEANIE